MNKLLAAAVAFGNNNSADPRIKVGACLYCHKTRTSFFGSNNFPSDFPNKNEIWNRRSHVDDINKADLVVHAEVAAANVALKKLHDLSCCTLYCTYHPCIDCLRDVVILNNIKHVVYALTDSSLFTPREEKVLSILQTHYRIKIEHAL